MGRERVTQSVRRHPSIEAGHARGALDGRPGLLSRQAAAAGRHEERIAARGGGASRQRGWPHFAVVAAEPFEGNLAHRHHPLLVALPDDPHETTLEGEILAVQAECLADPQAGRVQQLEERTVSEACGRGSRPGVETRVAGALPQSELGRTDRLEHALDLLNGQDLREVATLARKIDV